MDSDTDVKAPETLDSTVFKSEAIDSDVLVNAPDTFASTLSILVCKDAVAEFNEAVTVPKVVTLDCNEAVASPKESKTFFAEPPVIVMSPDIKALEAVILFITTSPSGCT